VAYDDALAARIRAVLDDETHVVEQPMFGGLAFLLDGNMTVTVSSRGGIMVRVPPDETDEIVEGTVATPMIMRNRPVHGWVRVAAKDLGTEAGLRDWVGRGVDYARSLPPK
jgi:TfoX N-terminal domain